MLCFKTQNITGSAAAEAAQTLESKPAANPFNKTLKSIKEPGITVGCTAGSKAHQQQICATADQEAVQQHHPHRPYCS
jgi:hypothetical protein